MQKIIKKIKASTALSSLATLVVPFVSKAQNDVNNGLSTIRNLFPSTTFNSVPQFIAFVIQILLFITGGVAVLFIIIGGFQYITSAGNAETATKGRKTVINAVIGLVLIILSYLIVSVIVNTLLDGSYSIF